MEALECQGLTKIYTSGLIRKKIIVGAKNVSFRIRRGEIVGLVGESGSGKTTVARIILRLIQPTSGDILLDGESIFSYDKREYYKRVQGVFQDPYSACNPFYRIDRILDKALSLVSNSLSSTEKNDLIRSTLKTVMLNPD
ncbi:MAG: ATP-binding cassette domain-containing protein, partial [Candidatus Brockarchaeota archaeon]|nr:ATP-binding cassette domain-containing protein [Candidatus Brockarchaeota archaeon]